VLFKYNSSISWTDLEKHFKEFAALRTSCLKPNGKPYMVSMSMGKNHSWEPYSKGMTHAFILEFANALDRDYYLLKDPVHHAFSAKAGPIIEDSLVMDFEDGRLFADSTSNSAASYVGSCHCGEIEWTVRLDNPQHILCHCDTCKKLGGGPFSCNQIVPKDDLRLTRGSPRIYTYTGASGKPVLCFHCGNCTSHIYHQQMIAPEKIIVRTMLLEGGSKMGVGGEIFGEGSLGWVRNIGDALPN